MWEERVLGAHARRRGMLEGKTRMGVRLSVQRYGGCDFGCFCGECWGGAAMKGLSCFFIVVTMVYVMLSFLGGESFAGAWGIFLADMEKGEIRGFGKRNVGAG
ncbi:MULTISPECIES: hypothetical protein [unclassified Bartonella]|uniref:hypothetical protein n=1 Tax=unclassified Bartonella TaxID=2645622 RepID=UPI0035CFDB19